MNKKPLKIIIKDEAKSTSNAIDDKFVIEISRKLDPFEAKALLYEIFGTDEVGVVNISDVSDDFIDEFNSIGCTSFQFTVEELEKLIKE